MTLGQMRLFLREGERLKRAARAAFIGDVYCAVAGMMGEGGGDHVQAAIDRLLED
jgi:hypothetical protein